MKGYELGSDCNGPTIKNMIHSETPLYDFLNSVPGSKPFVGDQLMWTTTNNRQTGIWTY